MFIVDKSFSIIDIAKSLVEGESNFVANAANLSSLIYNYYDDLNWAGLYMLNGDELVLSAFQGKPACIRIKIGKGVCGACAELNKPLIVHNVEEFPGHIACDSDSKSEMVVPIVYRNNFIGLFDLDSPIYNRFTDEMLAEIQNIIELLLRHSDMDRITKYYSL